MLPFDQLSFWEKSTFLNNVDYLVIGSGIVGLSTAIHLKKSNPNKKVCVVDRGYLPTGASSKNAGFACIGSASELLDDLTNNDESTVFNTVKERWEGLIHLRELLGDSAIDYFSLGSHELFTPTEKVSYIECLDQLSYLNQELFTITGIKEVYSKAGYLCKQMNFKGFNQAISNAAEGQLNTGKMIHRLAQLAFSLDIHLLNGINVISIDKQSANTTYGKITFEKAAICINGLTRPFLPEEDIQPARAQVVVTSPISNLALKGIFHFDKGYSYFRNIDNRVLLGGGRNLNFEAEETDELNTSDQIINYLSHILETQILPDKAFTIDYLWAGTMGVGKQKSPIVKQVDSHLFCGVRLGGMGVAIGSNVGKKLALMMVG